MVILDIKSRFREILFVIIGLTMALGGVFLLRVKGIFPTVEVLEDDQSHEISAKLFKVEIAGSVANPGVYSLAAGSRVDDLIASAGGLLSEANSEWVSHSLNRAAKLVDGQKIVIPSQNQQSEVLAAKNEGEGGPPPAEVPITNNQFSNTVNINTASQKQLEDLKGIGPVTARKIIEHRPYSDVSELKTKKILKSSIYLDLKDKLTVY
jgi:competence protein ComEA